MSNFFVQAGHYLLHFAAKRNFTWNCCSRKWPGHHVVCCSCVAVCCAFWCPCVSFGRIVEILDQGTTGTHTHTHIYPSPPSSIAAREWSHEWVSVCPELLYMASSFVFLWYYRRSCLFLPHSPQFLITISAVLHGVLALALWSTAAACLTGGAIFYLIHQHTYCGALYTCGYRAKLRRKYGLPEEPCNDCCTDCFCLPCSLAQQTRELQNHGVTPYLGIIQSSS